MNISALMARLIREGLPNKIKEMIEANPNKFLDPFRKARDTLAEIYYEEPPDHMSDIFIAEQ